MDNQIRYEDFTNRVSNEIEDAIVNWLEESASEIESQTITRTGTGAYHREIASKWKHVVDRNKLTATIGNPLENALWVEFGTGEFALNDDGRKGYWVYVEGQTSSNPSQKQYTLKEAKQAVAYLRSKGLNAHYTCGTLPKRPLHYAFLSSEEDIKNNLKRKLRNI